MTFENRFDAVVINDNLYETAELGKVVAVPLSQPVGEEVEGPFQVVEDEYGLRHD